MEPLPWQAKLAMIAIAILICRIAARFADGIVR